jgi:hypothetical protein
METPKIQTQNLREPSFLDTWFDDFVAKLRTDQLLLTTDSAREEVKRIYDTMMSGDELKIAQLSRQQSSMSIIKKIILDYINIISGKNINTIKIAVTFSESKVLIWAIIRDNDEAAEKALILTEAEINFKYNSTGFNISSIILEESDSCPIPSHYQLLT